MAKKKQQPKKIFVKRPEVGNEYYFYFAGGWEKGVLLNTSEKLTSHYGEKWFTLENITHGRNMKYPVAIYNLREKIEDTKK